MSTKHLLFVGGHQHGLRLPVMDGVNVMGFGNDLYRLHEATPVAHMHPTDSVEHAEWMQHVSLEEPEAESADSTFDGRRLAASNRELKRWRLYADALYRAHVANHIGNVLRGQRTTTQAQPEGHTPSPATGGRPSTPLRERSEGQRRVGTFG